jgi:hypothetical protein
VRPFLSASWRFLLVYYSFRVGFALDDSGHRWWGLAVQCMGGSPLWAWLTELVERRRQINELRRIIYADWRPK